MTHAISKDNPQSMKIVSACLLGIKCRYHGERRIYEKTPELVGRKDLIPVCPEQLGGLPTPREPAEIRESGDGTRKVFSRSGEDLTENFRRGAEETLRIAKLFDIKEAIFKEGSASCGCGNIYDGTFRGNMIEGDGMTAALLKENGVKIISEEEL